MILPNTRATCHFNSPRRYGSTVRVLEVRKQTARVEAIRGDGKRVKRFVKVSRLRSTQ